MPKVSISIKTETLVLTEFSVTYSELEPNTLYGCTVYAANLMGTSESAMVNVTTDSNSSGDTNTSSDSNNTLASIDIRELAGNTIITTSGKNPIEEIAYVFGANDAVTMVFNRRDGGQFVKTGTYVLSDQTNQLTVELQFDTNTFLYYSLFYENHLIYPKEYISLNMTVTKIATNAENGIIIQNDQPVATSDALTVTSIDDLKGYTITSNESDNQENASIVINCDGSSDTAYNLVASGQTYSDTAHHSLIEMHPELIYTRIDVGEFWLLLSSTNQLVENKTCIGSFNDDGTCSGNWKIQTIEQTTQCQ